MKTYQLLWVQFNKNVWPFCLITRICTYQKNIIGATLPPIRLSFAFEFMIYFVQLLLFVRTKGISISLLARTSQNAFFVRWSLCGRWCEWEARRVLRVQLKADMFSSVASKSRHLTRTHTYTHYAHLSPYWMKKKWII